MRTYLLKTVAKWSKPILVVAALCAFVPRSTIAAERKIELDAAKGLGGWTTAGDISIDPNRGPGGTAAIKVGAGGSALLKLRDTDGSGSVDMWVFDDVTTPSNFKTNRVGPRWGLVASNGRVLATGIFYAPYLGGNEGYTASACDGKAWFDQLFWLGVNRAPAMAQMDHRTGCRREYTNPSRR